MITQSFKVVSCKDDKREVELLDGKTAIIFSRVHANHEITTWRKKYAYLLYLPDFTQKNIETVARTIVKKAWCDAIIDVDMMPKKNSSIQYTSLLDHGLVKECATKNVSVFVSLQSIQDSQAHESYIMRVLQSKKLCTKYKVPHSVVNISENHINDADLLSFSHLLK